MSMLRLYILSSILKLPFIRQLYWSFLYQKAAKHIYHDDFIFLNLGYADLSGTDSAENCSIQALSERLYRHVVHDISIRDKNVLEVGCGRGGGSAYVMREFEPRALIGVDIAENAIRRCRLRFGDLPGLSFQKASAMSLPFDEGSFDAVINVESSHCYPSRKKFFKQVSRVLKPGGHFLFTDIFQPSSEKVDDLVTDKMLSDCGFVVLHKVDITDNVFKSRKLASESVEVRETLRRWVDTPGSEEKKSDLFQKLWEGQFLKGTKQYFALQRHELKYWSWVAKKPE